MELASQIIGWYRNNFRRLPWRETRDPYRIWVSEVILQQTRVDQGLPYYQRFLEKFPDIYSLASAPEKEVLKIWQGLGYYSRARNMQAAAKVIVERFNGSFPRRYQELIQLKGIGDYTASAVASFAFDQPHPVIDGNVMRLVARLKGISVPVDSTTGRKMVLEFLQKEIPEENPGIFNQAVMEFGAVVCKPRKPLCSECPFSGLCKAFNKGIVNNIPVKMKKQAPTLRFFHYFVPILKEDNQVFTFVKQRSGKDIWKDLYEFPSLESDHLYEWEELVRMQEFGRICPGRTPALIDSGTLQHILSHRKLYARYFLYNCRSVPTGYIRVNYNDLKDYPVSRLIEKIRNRVNITFSALKD